MKKIMSLVLGLLIAAFIISIPKASLAEGTQVGPTVDKSSIILWTRKLNFYYPKPGQMDDKKCSWLPLMDFKINGPIAAGTTFFIDYTLPGNKPWVSVTLTSTEVPAGGWYTYDRAGNDIADEKGTMATGLIDFKIRMVNELEGTKATLLTGKINVKKYNFFQPDKNKFDYYIDQDWRLPLATIYGNWGEISYGGWVANQAPYLWVDAWFRNELESQAFVFYKGKKIGSNENTSSARSITTFETSTNNWYSYHYAIPTILWYNNEEVNSHPDAFNLSQNPGDYEIKILQKGSLARVIQFKIGNDGKLVDNGYATQVNNKTQWILPAKVTGTIDGKWDKKSYEKGAFYGNPLNGFIAP